MIDGRGEEGLITICTVFLGCSSTAAPARIEERSAKARCWRSVTLLFGGTHVFVSDYDNKRRKRRGESDREGL